MKYALLIADNPHLDVLFAHETSRVHGFSHLALVKRKSQIATASRRVFISRNPARRLLSGFLSKFVMTPEAAVTQAICDFAELSAEDISFRSYVKTLSAVPDVYLDPHFRSQEDFLIMPIENYEVISLDGTRSGKYTTELDSIYPDSSQRFFSYEEAQETAKLGPILDRDRTTVPSRLSDAPVKHLRYLRLNGGSLPREEFFFDGFEELAGQRYSFDYQINDIAAEAIDPT